MTLNEYMEARGIHMTSPHQTCQMGVEEIENRKMEIENSEIEN